MSILDPRLWLAVMLAIVLSFGAGYWRGDVAGHKAIQAKWDAAKIVQFDAAQRAEATNRAIESDLKTKVIEAQNANQERIKKITSDAAVTKHTTDGLRSDLAAIRRQLPSLAADAVAKYAATATYVLSECTEKYRGMAEVADRLSADSLMYQNAWPEAAK